MPYNRRYRPRRRFTKRYATTRPSGFFGNAMKVAKTALGVAKFVKGVVNAEKKTYTEDFGTTGTPITPSSNGSQACVSDIAQGDDYNARSGRTIRIKSIQWFGRVNINASSSFTNVRLVMYMDRDIQTSGTPLTLTDLIPSVYSLKSGDPVLMKRVRILFDRAITLTADGKESHTFNKYLRCSIPLVFPSTVGASAQNSIFVVAMSNEGTNFPNVISQVRLRYYDN